MSSSDGIARPGFDFDLNLLAGEAREDALIHVLTKAKVEHKEEKQCRKTGNLFIEISQNGGKPSGLAVTIAEIHAFEFDDNCWLIIPTEKLKAITRPFYKRNGVVPGGDNDNMGVLVPIIAMVPHKSEGDSP